MRTSETITSIAPAFFACQAALNNPALNATAELDDHTEHRYANLAGVIDETRPALARYGLFFTQDVATIEGGVLIDSTCMHISGEWFAWGPLRIPCQPDAWSIASAIAYGRRYAEKAVFHLEGGEDDDGKTAHQRPPRPAAPAQRSSAAAKPRTAAKGPDKATAAQVARVFKLYKATGHTDDDAIEADVKLQYDYVKVLKPRTPTDLLKEHATELITRLESEAK